jgi:choline dehydrogenase-like flavoprotein
MEHPHFWSGMLVPSKANVFSRTTLYNDIHTVNGNAIVGKLALTEKAIRREKLLNHNVQLFVRSVLDPFKYRQPDSRAVLSCKTLMDAALQRRRVEGVAQHLTNTLGGLDKVAAAAARKMRHMVLGVPHTPLFIFAHMMEQVPNPESRVSLGAERDLFGQNRVRLAWRITEQDMRSAIRTQEIIAGALERIGLGRWFQEMREAVPPGNTEGGYHHMGTTRMHVDPKCGVVDANSRMHSVGNLYIAGPSVFPTGGYANPVLTLVALTLRLADHLKGILV